jgi:hypothetical protein
VTLLRISPYLQPNLVPGAAQLIQTCAKCTALTAGRAFVQPSDYKTCIKDALRHQISARAGSPYTAMDILEASMAKLTFPN